MPSSVSDLWMHETQQWNQDLLSTTFSPHTVQIITQTPVVQSSIEDILRWRSTTNDICTSKATYTYLQQQQQHTLPPTGSIGISPQADIILQKIWNGKFIPPLFKTFVWRLIRLALATAERVGRYAT
jgi:hypothetical protein